MKEDKGGRETCSNSFGDRIESDTGRKEMGKHKKNRGTERQMERRS